jgi:hypothetical protein
MSAPDHTAQRDITLFHIERGKLLVEMQRTRLARQESRGHPNPESRRLLRELESALRNFQTHLRFLQPETEPPN